MPDFKQQLVKDIENGFVPFYMNATAGTTVLCAFDNLSELYFHNSKDQIIYIGKSKSIKNRVNEIINWK